MGRRGNGEGSIRKRKDGRWEGRYTAHTPEGRRQKTVYGVTRKEVSETLTEAMADRNKGLVFDAGKLTVGDHLEQWLEDVVKPSASHRTYSTNAQQVRTHLAPTLGRIKLKSLRKAHIDRLYREKLDSGLSPSTVRRIHAVLHRALEEAVKGELLPRNPAAHANKPKVKQEEIEPLDTSQAAAFLKAAKGDRFESLYIVCLLCGLRRGARAPLAGHRPRRGYAPGEPPATARPGRGWPPVLRAQERQSPHRGAPSAGRELPQEPPQAPDGGEAEGGRLRGLRTGLRIHQGYSNRRPERREPLLQTSAQASWPPPHPIPRPPA